MTKSVYPQGLEEKDDLLCPHRDKTFAYEYRHLVLIFTFGTSVTADSARLTGLAHCSMIRSNSQKSIPENTTDHVYRRYTRYELQARVDKTTGVHVQVCSCLAGSERILAFVYIAQLSLPVPKSCVTSKPSVNTMPEKESVAVNRSEN